jgi:hypothetical protein
VACDFFDVDTVLLKHLFVLFMIELSTRRGLCPGRDGEPDRSVGGPTSPQPAHGLRRPQRHDWRSSRTSATDAKPQVNAMDKVFGIHRPVGHSGKPCTTHQ